MSTANKKNKKGKLKKPKFKGIILRDNIDQQSKHAEEDEYKEIFRTSKNNREIYNKLTARGESIMICDHILTPDEIKKHGYGMSDYELAQNLVEHTKNDTLHEFIGDLLVNLYTKHARLNDLTLLDE